MILIFGSRGVTISDVVSNSIAFAVRFLLLVGDDEEAEEDDIINR
jgi:hypothetical protein